MNKTAMNTDFGLMAAPKCEICGEADCAVQTMECGMCDDCAADAIREALEPLFGKCAPAFHARKTDGCKPAWQQAA